MYIVLRLQVQYLLEILGIVSLTGIETREEIWKTNTTGKMTINKNW